jgi:hypothetical protein
MAGHHGSNHKPVFVSRDIFGIAKGIRLKMRSLIAGSCQVGLVIRLLVVVDFETISHLFAQASQL